jgi:hypothetical protein
VEVLDVTGEFCRAGEMLTTRTSLGDLVTFRHASALDMPHLNASIGTVWMQHSSMNVVDKNQPSLTTQRALRWFQERLAAANVASGEVSPLGLHLVLGADLGQIFRNFAHNLQEDRVVVVQGVFERP